MEKEEIEKKAQEVLSLLEGVSCREAHMFLKHVSHLIELNSIVPKDASLRPDNTPVTAVCPIQ
jgi:hypothetical protein